MKTIREIVVTLASALICITLTGCGKSLDGSYVDKTGLILVEFKSGGRALLKMSGAAHEGDYSIDGATVTIRTETGTTVLTINGDGTLSGPPPLGVFTKMQ